MTAGLEAFTERADGEGLPGQHLLFVSRNRDRLGQAFRFVIAAPEQVEALVDKVSFGALASDLGLPVPPTSILSPVPGSRPPPGLAYPVVVKPRRRCTELWAPVTWAKAVPVATPDQLEALWPRLVAVGQPALAQMLVPGPESRIVSYHCYVDDRGATVAEFTGRKLRTRPRDCGHTTALEITTEQDVLEAGRATVRPGRRQGGEGVGGAVVALAALGAALPGEGGVVAQRPHAVRAAARGTARSRTPTIGARDGTPLHRP